MTHKALLSTSVSILYGMCAAAVWTVRSVLRLLIYRNNTEYELNDSV